MANIIEEQRKKRGITQRELAKSLNLSQSQISKLSRGEFKQLSFNTARKIQDFCGISLDEVFSSVKGKSGR